MVKGSLSILDARERDLGSISWQERGTTHITNRHWHWEGVLQPSSKPSTTILLDVPTLTSLCVPSTFIFMYKSHTHRTVVRSPRYGHVNRGQMQIKLLRTSSPEGCKSTGNTVPLHSVLPWPDRDSNYRGGKHEACPPLVHWISLVKYQSP
jgi:hypothetical protein